jgi:phage shock protein A
MGFKWLEIFGKGNEIAKAHADAAIDAHADPHDLLRISIRNLQDDHEKLQRACALVIGQFNTARAKLERDLAQEQQLSIRGKAAAQADHTDSAQAIARQLVSLRGIIATEQTGYDQLKAASEKAQLAFQENSEMLAAKMEEAKQLSAQIDQAAVAENIAQAMRDVSSMTSHTTPSFDQVRQQVQARQATAEADAQLQGSIPELSEIHEQHLASVAAADDVMAEWATPVSLPPAPARRVVATVGPKSTTRTAKTTGGSPSDRLN